jgi:hypothetical protein
MDSSAQNFSELAELFRADAKEHQNIPSLNKDSKQRCLEFFFDNARVPNFVVLDGKIIQAILPKKTRCFCLAGDEGPIFIQVFGETLLDKRGDWELPDLDYSDLQEKLDLLIKKAQSFYSGGY